MAETHSFDIVCKVEMHEVHNAVDQAKKQLAVRYDFKGSKADDECAGTESAMNQG